MCKIKKDNVEIISTTSKAIHKKTTKNWTNPALLII